MSSSNVTPEALIVFKFYASENGRITDHSAYLIVHKTTAYTLPDSIAEYITDETVFDTLSAAFCEQKVNASVNSSGSGVQHECNVFATLLAVLHFTEFTLYTSPSLHIEL